MMQLKGSKSCAALNKKCFEYSSKQVITEPRVTLACMSEKCL
jgi:hypothetical protein